MLKKQCKKGLGVKGGIFHTQFHVNIGKKMKICQYDHQSGQGGLNLLNIFLFKPLQTYRKAPNQRCHDIVIAKEHFPAGTANFSGIIDLYAGCKR